MFDIDNLITEDIRDILTDKSVEKQTEFLLNLIEFNIYYPKYSNSISHLWYTKCNERYDASQYLIADEDKEFIAEYAKNTEDINKVKELINKLCSLSDGVLSYDEVIAEAEKDMCVIQDLVEISDKSANKPSLKSLLSLKIDKKK